MITSPLNNPVLRTTCFGDSFPTLKTNSSGNPVLLNPIGKTRGSRGKDYQRRLQMRQIILLVMVLLFTASVVYADVIYFEVMSVERSNHVEGEIWMYNNLLNIWEPAPAGQLLSFRLQPISGSGAPPVFVHNVPSQRTGGYYYNFHDIPQPYTLHDFEQVRLTFRGIFYYAPFNNGRAYINIWWIQAY